MSQKQISWLSSRNNIKSAIKPQQQYDGYQAAAKKGGYQAGTMLSWLSSHNNNKTAIKPQQRKSAIKPQQR
jgi:hypothetical protein